MGDNFVNGTMDGHSYNKGEEDFPSLVDYNNYLEEVEDISK